MIVVLVCIVGGPWEEKAKLAGCGDACTPVMLRTGNWGRRIVSLGSLSLWKEGGGGKEHYTMCVLSWELSCVKKKVQQTSRWWWFTKPVPAGQGMPAGVWNASWSVHACWCMHSAGKDTTAHTEPDCSRQWGAEGCSFPALMGLNSNTHKGDGESMYHTLYMGTEGPGMHSLN